MKFLCSSCGACCRRAGKAGLMPDRGDGACIYLGSDNLCTIYETRPYLCNVEAMFSVRKKEEPKLTLKEHYIRNNKICNQWIEEDGMSDEYKIDVEQYDMFDMQGGMFFHPTGKTTWIMCITDNGKIRFNRKDYPEMFEDEFAKEIGKILERIHTEEKKEKQ